MYRPTVRYDNSFKDYVNDLYKVTDLDRNQIMRLALFCLGHSIEGKKILNEHLTDNHPLPSPAWSLADHGLWMEQTWSRALEGGTSGRDVPHLESKDVIVEITNEREGRHENTRPQGTVRPTTTSSGTGGIKLFIGSNGIQTIK